MSGRRTVRIIATHNGPPHFDDWMSVALYLMLYPDAQVIRTRDSQALATADVVLDVGEVCDAATGRRDHHGRAEAGRHPNGTKRATLGLTWNDIGLEICRFVVPDSAIPPEELAAEVLQQLVLQADAHDNGQLALASHLNDNHEVPIPVVTLCGLFELLRPVLLVEDTSDEAMDRCFREQLPLLQLIARKFVMQALSLLSSVKLVEPSEVRCDGAIIVLPQRCAWEHAVARLFPKALYVVLPSKSNWRCHTVATVPGGFIPKRRLPAAWSGKSGEDVSAMTKVDGVVFVHRELFVAETGTRETAIQLAECALPQQP